MSSSSEIVDSRRYSTQNMPVRSPEWSSFSQTCNLFSQYLKENSTVPDLTLGKFLSLGRGAPQLTTTMSLFSMADGAAQQQVMVPQKQQKDESKTMTMFYNGQVMVFNDLAPEKVKEIMKLAEQGCAQKAPKLEQPLKITAASDLPIARKASLARFLEKRKDRITARSPYQLHDVSKQEDSKEWLGLGGGGSH